MSGKIYNTFLSEERTEHHGGKNNLLQITITNNIPKCFDWSLQGLPSNWVEGRTEEIL